MPAFHGDAQKMAMQFFKPLTPPLGNAHRLQQANCWRCTVARQSMLKLSAPRELPGLAQMLCLARTFFVIARLAPVLPIIQSVWFWLRFESRFLGMYPTCSVLSITLLRDKQAVQYKIIQNGFSSSTSEGGKRIRCMIRFCAMAFDGVHGA